MGDQAIINGHKVVCSDESTRIFINQKREPDVNAPLVHKPGALGMQDPHLVELCHVINKVLEPLGIQREAKSRATYMNHERSVVFRHTSKQFSDLLGVFRVVHFQFRV